MKMMMMMKRHSKCVIISLMELWSTSVPFFPIDSFAKFQSDEKIQFHRLPLITANVCVWQRVASSWITWFLNLYLHFFFFFLFCVLTTTTSKNVVPRNLVSSPFLRDKHISIRTNANMENNGPHTACSIHLEWNDKIVLCWKARREINCQYCDSKCQCRHLCCSDSQMPHTHVKNPFAQL